MCDLPGWHYDDMRQVGVDFESPREVEAYDRNQGSDPAEDRDLLKRLGVRPDHVVIDFGCGTGLLLLAAARMARQVHAVDVSAPMLDFARNRASAAGMSNIAFHRAGFLTYRHDGEPADLVFTRYAFHHLPDFWKVAALRRMAKMLKPGGRLYLKDVVYSFPPDEYEAGIEGWIDRVARPEGSGFTRRDFQTHVREEFSTYGWLLEEMFRRTGFRIESADYLDDAYAEYICVKPGG